MNIKLPVLLDSQLKNDILFFKESSDPKYWTVNTTGNTCNRKFCTIGKYDLPLAHVIKEYSHYIFKKLGAIDFKEEELFNNFLGVNSAGGNVHPHKDPKSKEGWDHVRVNFLVQKPVNGGMPVINETVYTIEEDEAWLNIASDWLHSSTVVYGTRDRVVLSLGAFVKPESTDIIRKYIL